MQSNGGDTALMCLAFCGYNERVELLRNAVHGKLEKLKADIHLSMIIIGRKSAGL